MFDIKKFLTENKIYITEKKINYMAMSKRLQKVADANLKAMKKEYAGEKDMLDMFKADHARLQSIAKLILRGKLATAGERAWSMDTAAREEIPEDIYDAIMDAVE